MWGVAEGFLSMKILLPVIKNKFKSVKFTYVFMAMVLANPLGVFGSSAAFAATENITKIVFTSAKMDAKINEGLELRVQTQNIESNPEILTTSANKVLLETSSSTGKFYSSCTNLTRSINSLTMRLNSSNASFCYIDSTPGDHKITVRPESFSWDHAEVSVSIVDLDSETPPEPIEPDEPEAPVPLPPENNPVNPPTIENPPIDAVAPTIELAGVEEGRVYTGDIAVIGRVLGENTFSSLKLNDINGNTTEFQSIKNQETREHILLIKTKNLVNGRYTLVLEAENRIGESVSTSSILVNFYVANELPKLAAPEIKSLILEDGDNVSEVKNIIGRDFLNKSQRVKLKASGSSTDYYQLDIYYPDGSNKVVNSSSDILTLIDTDKDLLNLDGKYQFRIRQIAASNTENSNSEWSEWFGFEITPATPVLDLPDKSIDLIPDDNLESSSQANSENKNKSFPVIVSKSLSNNLTVSRQNQSLVAVNISKGQSATVPAIAVKPRYTDSSGGLSEDSVLESKSDVRHDEVDESHENPDRNQGCYSIFGICWYNYIIPVAVVLVVYYFRKTMSASKSKQ